MMGLDLWRRAIANLALAATLLVGVAACTQETAPPLPASAIAPEGTAYHLGLGDKLRVNVYGEPTLSGEYQVSGNGALSMPLIGDVAAIGLTTRELETAITARYAAGYLKTPHVAVEVYDFRPYFVLGEVQKPGRYPSVEGQTLLGAIATAGGFTYRANQTRIFLRRAGDGTEYQVPAASEVKVQPGDVIRVGERYF